MIIFWGVFAAVQLQNSDLQSGQKRGSSNRSCNGQELLSRCPADGCHFIWLSLWWEGRIASASCYLAVPSMASVMVVHKVFRWADSSLLELRPIFLCLTPPPPFFLSPCSEKVKKIINGLWSAAGVQGAVAVAGVALSVRSRSCRVT